jgi:hypothetical protein
MTPTLEEDEKRRALLEREFIQAVAGMVRWAKEPYITDSMLDRARELLDHIGESSTLAVANTQEPRPPKIRCMRCDAERDFGVESCLCGDRTWRSEEPPERFESPKRKVHITPEGSREVDPHEILASPTIRKHLQDVHEAFHPKSPRPSEGSRSVESEIDAAREIGAFGNYGRAHLAEAKRLYREERAASDRAIADLSRAQEIRWHALVTVRDARDTAVRERDEARERIAKAANILARGTFNHMDRALAILRGEEKK